jgi:hypothetical protein
MTNKECCATTNYRRDLSSINRSRITNERKTRRSSIKELSSSGTRRYPGFSEGKKINIVNISKDRDSSTMRKNYIVRDLILRVYKLNFAETGPGFLCTSPDRRIRMKRNMCRVGQKRKRGEVSKMILVWC